ncbi:CBS domain-containing protein, partial [candidate division KSB3 bacterium]|nr:CBS domain-containing protein [candidate division KSB3 bacterium]MBD3326261.1 CBS domain-containing protein [candidate division KSB3 bacterium]
GVFPYYYEDLSASTYWWMGLFGALGLFASIIFHELWHSLIARKFGLPMNEITLFIFGGVANMEEEPPNAKAEFFMAIAGPIASIVLGIVFYGVSIIGQAAAWAAPIAGIVGYLSSINFILAAFNLVPAFPLDGGRVLRSALWSWKDNLRWATRIASRIGSGFGMLLIVLGVFTLISGSFIGGMWWALIGMFVLNASRMSYQKLLIRQVLEGEPVSRFMHTEPVTVSPSTPLDQLVEDYIYKYHFKMFPVSKNHEAVSCVSTRDVKEVPREEWGQHTVAEVATPCSSDNTIREDTDAMKALSRINRTKSSRLMVVDAQNQLVGILSLKDLLQFLSLKLDLEDEESLMAVS